LGLHAAVRAVQATRADQAVEIVWTGPQTAEVLVRLTRAVLVNVIRSATERLVIVSFAAYKVTLVVDELAVAADCGVDVRLVLETSEASSGGWRSTRPMPSPPSGRRPVFGSGRPSSARRCPRGPPPCTPKRPSLIATRHW
jgi:hypothetical protein